jgi:hypothetical protein
MTLKQKEQLEKFKKFTNWMCVDLERTIFCARANFLIAMVLFNYIEILGSFVIGFFEKDKTGNKKKDKKGKLIKTKNKDRFDKFFIYMGDKYKKLLDNNPDIYNELRCGLTHEYLPKKRKFQIFNPDGFKSEEEIDRTASCGVIFDSQNNLWKIINSKLYLDFKRAISRLIKEIEDGKNSELINNFFETADQINFENFG